MIYRLVEDSQKTGIALTESQLKQIAELEEQYIKEEVLPVIHKNIEPVLQKIQRDLTLVVNYKPNSPISLQISHDPKLADLEEAVLLTPDIIPELRKRNKYKHNQRRLPNTLLKVTMNNGKVFFDKNKAVNTFCDVIQHIGLIRVRSLDILASGINIVSTSFDPNRKQKKIGDFYIFVNRSNHDKAEILKKISDQLNLSMKIEVLEK